MTITVHTLKIDASQLDEILHGYKRHEVRHCHDRVFKIRDVLCLQVYDRQDKTYSGEQLRVEVTDITRPEQYGLPSNLCVMTIKLPGDTFAAPSRRNWSKAT